MKSIRSALKRLLEIALGGYAPYFIYSYDGNSGTIGGPANDASGLEIKAVHRSQIDAAKHPLIREQAWYAGAGSRVYACFDGDDIVAVCVYWYGERYRERNFWPLRESEAKLVQVVSVPEVRGRRVATKLIASSTRAMVNDGFSRIFARIWHSNHPSLKAFENAGWVRIALVIEINPFRRNHPLRLRFSL